MPSESSEGAASTLLDTGTGIGTRSESVLSVCAGDAGAGRTGAI